MADHLVRLLDLPDITSQLAEQKEKGVEVRHPIPPEKHIVVDWVGKNFSPAWASECEGAFNVLPVSCYIAVQEEEILGFACYEVTCKNYFGPIGIAENQRGKGLGKILLLSCLHAMRQMGYAYGIIGGGTSVSNFYAKSVGAAPIEGSECGIYLNMLR